MTTNVGNFFIFRENNHHVPITHTVVMKKPSRAQWWRDMTTINRNFFERKTMIQSSRIHKEEKKKDKHQKCLYMYIPARRTLLSGRTRSTARAPQANVPTFTTEPPHTSAICVCVCVWVCIKHGMRAYLWNVSIHVCIYACVYIYIYIYTAEYSAMRAPCLCSLRWVRGVKRNTRR